MKLIIESGLFLPLLSVVWARCPGGAWKSWNGFCYRLTATPLDWHGVRADCKSPQRGGDAASIASKAEQDFIRQSIAGSRLVWLGMRSHGGRHWWVDGSPVTFTHFRSSPAEEAGDVIQLEGSSGYWTQVSSYAGTKLHGVCKMASCGCPSGWKYWNNRCYKAVVRKLGWIEARQQCKRLSPTAELVTIHGPLQNDHAFKLAGGRIPIWIGLNDYEREGRFTWSGDGQLTYSNWYTGEPNGIRHTEDCVGMSEKGQWLDYGCHTIVLGESFVCERFACGRDAMVTEEPSRVGAVRLWRPEDGERCPIGWSRSGNKCFSSPTAADTFKGVQALCRRQHPQGAVAMISSLRDNDRAFLAATTLPAWIANGGDFANWRQGDSNRAGCVAMQESGQWLSEPCEKVQPGLCQVQTCKPECPGGWHFFEGNCYRVEENKYAADEAEAKCQAAGGHLTSILSQDENDFIFELTFPYSRINEFKQDDTVRNALIGATRADTESPWSWADCSNWTISRWIRKDGNVPSPGDTTCAVMNYAGRWNGGINCNTLAFRSVCKMDPCSRQFGSLSRYGCVSDRPTTPSPTTPYPSPTKPPQPVPPTRAISSVYYQQKEAVQISIEQPVKCPDYGGHWSEHEGFCLTTSKTAHVPFREAFGSCRSMGTNRFQVTLPVTKFPARQEALMNVADGQDVWLGLTRRWTGFWYWHDRIRARTLHWQKEPSSQTRCVAMDGKTGGLVARDCSDPLPYFCQARPRY